MSWDRGVFRGEPATREFIAFGLVGDRIAAGMNVNVWDVTDAILGSSAIAWPSMTGASPAPPWRWRRWRRARLRGCGARREPGLRSRCRRPARRGRRRAAPGRGARGEARGRAARAGDGRAPRRPAALETEAGRADRRRTRRRHLPADLRRSQSDRDARPSGARRHDQARGARRRRVGRAADARARRVGAVLYRGPRRARPAPGRLTPMGFLDRLMGGGDAGAGAGDERRDASLAAVEAGGLPLNAQDRLKELAADPNALFTSNLSVNAFALGEEADLDPVCQVMGS